MRKCETPTGMWLGTRARVWRAPVILAAALCLIPALGAAQERFPDQKWGVDLLVLLAAGPELLRSDLGLRVAPPPGPDETRQELDLLELISVRLRNDPTRHQIALEAGLMPEVLFQRAGLIPDRADGPALWELVGLTAREAGYFVLREKREHARPRPTQLRPRIGTMIPVPPHPAYPSGHAAQAHAIAGILAVLVPDCGETYRDFAAGVAFRREIAGLHFRSDTRAGELLARNLVPLLLTAPGMTQRVEGARRDLASHLSKRGCVRAGGDER